MRRIALLCLCLSAAPASAAPVSRQAFSAQPQPAPDATLSYGPSPSQAIDIYLPKTKGPHPVAILIHGGCWMKLTAGREQLRAVASELAGRGIAVWSVGYRRVDEDGGAYPGLYQDAAKAFDLLPANAAKYKFDLSRVVTVGHSAGAHLALWAAGRDKLPRTSPAYVASPYPVRNVIALGGVGDLEKATGLATVCGPTIMPAVVGSPSASRADIYSDTSPSKLLPTGTKILMVTGTEDKVTPPAYAQTYVDELKAAGSAAELVFVPDAAHFDVVTLGTPAWRLVSERIVAALKK